jgi:hypothetical protein
MSVFHLYAETSFSKLQNVGFWLEDEEKDHTCGGFR